MWPRIYRANREEIKDPDMIFPEQTLAVPFGVAENQYLVTRGDFLQDCCGRLQRREQVAQDLRSQQSPGRRASPDLPGPGFGDPKQLISSALS